PQGVAAGDVDGNGTLDLAVANAVSNDVTILRSIPCELHVASVEPNARRGSHGMTRVSSRVSVVDAGDAPQPGAVVEVQARLPDGSVIGLQGVTGDLGVATVTLYSSQDGRFCFRVAAIHSPGWTYDPASNLETGDCVSPG